MFRILLITIYFTLHYMYMSSKKSVHPLSIHRLLAALSVLNGQGRVGAKLSAGA